VKPRTLDRDIGKAGGMVAEHPLQLIGIETVQDEPHRRIGRSAAERQAKPAVQAAQMGPYEAVDLTIRTCPGQHRHRSTDWNELPRTRQDRDSRQGCRGSLVGLEWACGLLGLVRDHTNTFERLSAHPVPGRPGHPHGGLWCACGANREVVYIGR
jgi:hypothetical protein